MQIGSLHFVVALVAGWLQRDQGAVLEYLKEENKVLREQLGDKRILFTDAQRRRLARRGKAVGGRGLREFGCIVSPDTLLRWYRQLVAQKYDGSSRRGPGRPRTPGELARGYTRIRDVLRSLGHEIGRTTIQEILQGQGIEPAPSRKRRVTWSEFLRSHWGAIAACDFLTVEVLTLHRLVRYETIKNRGHISSEGRARACGWRGAG